MTFFTHSVNLIFTKKKFLKHSFTLICLFFTITITQAQVTEIAFSIERGFYDNPFTVELVPDDPAATIRYTIDNTKPSIASGILYTGPITISKTTSIRAIAYTGAIVTPVTTHSYIFLDDIITAPYMERNITNSATYGSKMRDALLAIPTVSLVSSDVDSNNLVSAEVETSVEMFFPDGTSAFQVHSGIQTWGSSTENLKKNYRLEFKSIYGTPELKYPLFDDDGYDYPIPAVNEFKKLLLRGASQDGLNCELCDESQAQFIRNRFIWDVQMEMGYPAPHGRFVHLYVNSEYMGHYQLMERPDESWYVSYYFPEKTRNQIEVRKSDEYWSQPVSPTFYSQMESAGFDEDYIDKQQTADYAILNDYGANFEWSKNNNNLGGADPVPGNGGYKFVIWDFDLTLGNSGTFAAFKPLVNFNSLGLQGPIPAGVNNDDEFKVMQGDRLECHCFNDGVLTPAVLDEMYMKRANQVQLPLIAESARWGNQPFNFSTVSHIGVNNWDVNDEWTKERQDVRNNYLPNRTNNLLNYYRNAGRYPSIQSVQFSQYGGDVNSGYQLTLFNPNANGTIYYTTNGTDPRLEGGGISPSAQVYSGPISIMGPLEIRARVRVSDSAWSAMCPRHFYVDQDHSALVINEIHYHASNICRNIDWEETEYIEIKNTGNTTLNLSDCRFSSGITYTFPPNATIAPQQFIVLAENASIFQQEFGFVPYDQYEGELSNAGETLILVDYKNEVLDSVPFNDRNSWDEMPDGNGPSLELRHPLLDNADPLNWFRSDQTCAGTPGQENSRTCATAATPILINEINYNSNNAVTDPGDWIELYNPNNTAVDISAWEFYDNINNFTIPIGTIIQPGAYLVLVEDATMFTDIFPNVTNYVGNFLFNLNQEEKRVSLFDDNKCMSDYVVFNDKTPWPTESGGEGPTLSLINPYNGADNSLPASWEASSAINSDYGTPGRINEACQEANIVAPSLICPTAPALFTLDNPDPNITCSWLFSGANPSFSDTDSTLVTWNDSGTYNVQLTTEYYECTETYNYPILVDCTVSETYTTPRNVPLNNMVSNPTPTSTNNLISGTTNGTIIFNPDGNFTYTPDSDFTGTDNFIYETCELTTVSDTLVYSSIKNYSGQVNSGANDVEERVPDGSIDATSTDLDLMVDDGNTYSTVGVRITNINIPAGAVIMNAYLQFTADEVQSDTTNLSINAEATGNSPAFSNIAYSVSSKTRTNATATWNNIAPWTIANTYNSTDISTVIQEIIDRGDWSSGNAMTFLLEGTGTRTAESYNGVPASAPRLFINYETIDSIIINPITRSVCMPSLAEINIMSVNNLPIAVDDNFSTDEEVPIIRNIINNDIKPNNGNLTTNINFISPPANGTASFLISTGFLSYTPNTNFYGTDIAEYEICDSENPVLCDTATITITVNPLPDAPIAIDDNASTQANTPLNANVLLNDIEPDGDNLIVSTPPLVQPSFGVLVLNSNGSYTYTPSADFTGTDSFEYEVCDDATPSQCSTARVVIIIEPDCIDIQIAAWMEGAYNPVVAEMTTELNVGRGLLPGQTPTSSLVSPTPAGQPYSYAPWNYTGTEGTGWTDADYASDVVDWVLVHFRTETTRSTELAKTAALLHKDGTIRFPNRCALPSGVGVDSVYILVEHRNHIGIMSPQAVEITNSTLTYDFRTADSFRDPTGFGQKQLPTGEWVMFGGDIDQSDIVSYDINGLDKAIWSAENGVFDNYRNSDTNMDGDVSGTDKILWFNNNGISSRVPK